MKNEQANPEEQKDKVQDEKLKSKKEGKKKNSVAKDLKEVKSEDEVKK